MDPPQLFLWHWLVLHGARHEVKPENVTMWRVQISRGSKRTRDKLRPCGKEQRGADDGKDHHAVEDKHHQGIQGAERVDQMMLCDQCFSHLKVATPL